MESILNLRKALVKVRLFAVFDTWRSQPSLGLSLWPRSSGPFPQTPSHILPMRGQIFVFAKSFAALRIDMSQWAFV